MFQRKRLSAIALAASFIALSMFGVTSSASASVGVEGLGPTTMAGSARLGYMLPIPNPDLNTLVAAAALTYMVTKDIVGAVGEAAAEVSSSSSDSSSSSSGGMITNPAGNPVSPATFDTAQ